ncbi:MFS transporter [Nonomuraea soli]|uniref:MFS family permease n=1 Tax=Nonomuraea soli TaxID=1032476 RepID=A0A7W0CHG5_9ACTN|nr:MFS transporter [Nonomuraea soli]MBA2891119.1 MFS family permease [Nonomuraea soli]
MRAVLRRKDFRLVCFGMAVSLLGDASLLLIPAILAKKLTGSNSAAGLTLFFFSLPLLFAPLFGVLIDRVDRRRLLVVTCLGSALALLPLAAVSAGSFWLLYAVSAAMGCSYTVTFAALGGLLKAMLPEELLAQANASLLTTRQGLRLVGPLLGVAIYSAFGLGAVVVFDMVTFGVAALAFALMPAVPYVRRGGGGVSWREEVGAGVRLLRLDPKLRRAGTALSVMFAVGGATESLIFAVIEALGRSPEFAAVTSTAMGVGAIGGGLVAAAAIGRWGELPAIGAGVGLYGVAIALWLVAAEGVMVATMAASGAGVTLTSVAMATLLQRRSPEEVVGRVATAFDAVSGGAQLVAVAAGALLVTLVDYRVLLVTVAGVCALAAWHAFSGGPRSLRSDVDLCRD